jgi:hypothetical protein
MSKYFAVASCSLFLSHRSFSLVSLCCSWGAKRWLVNAGCCPLHCIWIQRRGDVSAMQLLFHRP